MFLNLGDTFSEILERHSSEVGREAVKDNVHRGRCPQRAPARKVSMRQGQEGFFALLPKLPADDGVLAVGHSLPRPDLPFVLENMGRLPGEDPPGDVKLARAGAEVDGSAFAAVDEGSRHVPTRKMLGFRERFPHRLDWVPDAPLKCEGRVVAIKHECASPRGVGCRHPDRVSVVFVS